MKTITILICLVISVNAFSQDTLKATFGKVSTELNVNILHGELSFNNSINQVKIRYFGKDNKCYRFGIKIFSDNYKETGEYVYGSSPDKIEYKSNKLGVAFNYGIEWHLKGTKRLSPYIGFDLNFSDTWYKFKYKNSDFEVTYTNVTIDLEMIDVPLPTDPDVDEMFERANFSLGADLIIGFDYYLSKNIFLGYEFNYGGKYIEYKEMKSDIKTIGYQDDNDQNDFPDENSAHEFSFGPQLYNGIRIGFVF